MVIQRNWKTSNNNNSITSSENLHQTTSSSEDSNSSWQTLSNSTSSSHTKNFNNSKTSISNPLMAESVLKALKYRYNGRLHANQTNTESALMSMELMRLNVQDEFDKEIDIIVRKYIDNFFRPALKNVKENLGENSISNDCLQKISCNLLENAKSQYVAPPASVINSKPAVTMTTMQLECFRPIENEQEMQFLQQQQQQQQQQQPSVIAQKRKEQLPDDYITAEHYQENATNSAKRLRTIGRTKQIFWNVSYLNTDTLFVLDFKANQILGFGENSKERLASKHPELIRYLPDGNDKDWMLQQKILTPMTRSCRILLLVYDEVCKIAQTDEYRNKSTIKLSDLEGFKIPEFILHKMKIFFTELSLRSQSFLINNSVSQSTTMMVTSYVQSLSSSSNNIVSSSLPSTSSASATTTIIDSSNIKPKSSLSSSHATLSALLSNTASVDSSGNSSSGGTELVVDALTTFQKKENI